MHIVAGCEDRAIDVEYLAEFTQKVPRATMQVVVGAGHDLLRSHPMVYRCNQTGREFGALILDERRVGPNGKKPIDVN